MLATIVVRLPRGGAAEELVQDGNIVVVQGDGGLRLASNAEHRMYWEGESLSLSNDAY